jgi:hypothetical protein
LYTGFWWRSLREGDHWGDPDLDGRIILRRIFRKWEGVVGTGRSGLRIGTGGGHLGVLLILSISIPLCFYTVS